MKKITACLLICFALSAQEDPLNDELRALHKQLSDTCERVYLLQQNRAPDSDYQQLSKEARRLREEIRQREAQWIESARTE